MDEQENQNLEPQVSENKTAQTTNDATEQSGGSANRQVNAVKEGAQKVQQAIQGTAKKLVSKAFWTAAAPYIFPTLIIIVAIGVLAICITLIYRAYMGGFGKPPVQAANISQPEDRSELDELAKYTGAAPQFDAKKVAEIAQNINAKIDEGKLTFTDKDTAKATIAKIIELCNAGIEAKDKAKIKQVSELISKLIDSYAGNPDSPAGSFGAPVDVSKITSFNNTLHGGSVMHPGNWYNKDGTRMPHNVFKGFTTPGVGDAVDITTGYGSPFYAMYDGQTEKKNSCVVLTSTDKKIESWYCHVHNFDSKLGNVTKGTQIGDVGVITKDKKGNEHTISHVHLEVWIDGKSIHTTSTDIASKKNNDLGRYLWDRIKATLKF